MPRGASGRSRVKSVDYFNSSMTQLLNYKVCFVLVTLFSPSGSYPQSGLYSGDGRARRGVSCRDDLEYPNGNICCLNCPPGTYVKSPCITAGGRGQCEECDDGTFIEHASGQTQCFECTPCHPDQEIVRPCNHTQDTVCQCKSGRFCDPNQPCEVCRKCSRCENDEKIVRNCTSTTNTECKKIQPKSDSASDKTVEIVVTVVIVAVILAVILLVLFVVFKCRAGTTESQRNRPDGMKAGLHFNNCPTEESGNEETRRPSSITLMSCQLVRAKSSVGVEDERAMLCESLDSSASNSQHSLTGLPPAFPASAPRASPVVPRQPNRREDEQLPQLVPVNGQVSLKRCFEYFEELDISHHKRFFRHLGISDNMIKSREDLPYEDRIHELLNIWVEKEGKEASLNDLLKALIDLHQRRTAETVKEKAIHYGHYVSEN